MKPLRGITCYGLLDNYKLGWVGLGKFIGGYCRCEDGVSLELYQPLESSEYVCEGVLAAITCESGLIFFLLSLYLSYLTSPISFRIFVDNLTNNLIKEIAVERGLLSFITDPADII